MACFDVQGSQTPKKCPIRRVFGISKVRIMLNTKNTLQGVLLVFGDGGNTRHVKCAHLNVFYASGGERRVPNMKYMPILACISCLVQEDGCRLLIALIALD